MHLCCSAQQEIQTKWKVSSQDYCLPYTFFVHTSSTEISTRRNTSYSLQQGFNTKGATPTQALDPNYDIVGSHDEDVDAYDRLQHSQHQTDTTEEEPALPQDKEDKSNEDFYTDSLHTYTEVNTEHRVRVKKKAGEGGSPVYEVTLPGEMSWGPPTEGYSKLQK